MFTSRYVLSIVFWILDFHRFYGDRYTHVDVEQEVTRVSTCSTVCQYYRSRRKYNSFRYVAQIEEKSFNPLIWDPEFNTLDRFQMPRRKSRVKSFLLYTIVFPMVWKLRDFEYAAVAPNKLR